MSGEWIPVTERLPDDGSEYLVWYGGFRHCTVVVRRGGEFLKQGMRITENVTHWMPLPAPPSDGK